MSDTSLADEYAATGGEYVPSPAEEGPVFFALSNKDKGYYTDMLTEALIGGAHTLNPSIVPTEGYAAQHYPEEIIAGANEWLKSNVEGEIWTYELLEDLMTGFDINEGFEHAWAQVLPETPQWNIRNVLAANGPVSFLNDIWREGIDVFPVKIGAIGYGTREKGEGHRRRMAGRGTNPYTSTPLGNLIGVHDWTDAIDITLDLLDLGLFTGGTVIRTAIRTRLLRGERTVAAKIKDKVARNIPVSVFEQQRMADFHAFEVAHAGNEAAMVESTRIFGKGQFGTGWTSGYAEQQALEKLAAAPLVDRSTLGWDYGTVLARDASVDGTPVTIDDIYMALEEYYSDQYDMLYPLAGLGGAPGSPSGRQVVVSDIGDDIPPPVDKQHWIEDRIDRFRELHPYTSRNLQGDESVNLSRDPALPLRDDEAVAEAETMFDDIFAIVARNRDSSIPTPSYDDAALLNIRNTWEALSPEDKWAAYRRYLGEIDESWRPFDVDDLSPADIDEFIAAVHRFNTTGTYLTRENQAIQNLSRWGDLDDAERADIEDTWRLMHPDQASGREADALEDIEDIANVMRWWDEGGKTYSPNYIRDTEGVEPPIPHGRPDPLGSLTGTTSENKAALYDWGRRINELTPQAVAAQQSGDELFLKAFRESMDEIHREIEEYAARFPSIRDDTEWEGMRNQIAAYQSWRRIEQERLGPQFDESPVPADASQATPSGRIIHGLPVENTDEILNYLRAADEQLTEAIGETVPWGAWSKSSSDTALEGVEEIRAAVSDPRVHGALDRIEAKVRWADREAEASRHPLRLWLEQVNEYLKIQPAGDTVDDEVMAVGSRWMMEPAMTRIIADAREWILQNPQGYEALRKYAAGPEDVDAGDDLLAFLMDPTAMEQNLHQVGELIEMARGSGHYDELLTTVDATRADITEMIGREAPELVPPELNEMLRIWSSDSEYRGPDWRGTPEPSSRRAAPGRGSWARDRPWQDMFSRIEGLSLRSIIESAPSVIADLQEFMPQMRQIVREWDELGEQLGDPGFSQLIAQADVDEAVVRVRAFGEMVESIRTIDESMTLAGLGVNDEGVPHQVVFPDGTGVPDEALDLPLLTAPEARMTPIRKEWLEKEPLEREREIRAFLEANPGRLNDPSWRRISTYLDNNADMESVETLFTDRLRQQVADWRPDRTIDPTAATSFYHGTSGDFEDFEYGEGSLLNPGTWAGGNNTPNADSGLGFHFSTSPDSAQFIGPNIMERRLRLENPLEVQEVYGAQDLRIRAYISELGLDDLYEESYRAWRVAEGLPPVSDVTDSASRLLADTHERTYLGLWRQEVVRTQNRRIMMRDHPTLSPMNEYSDESVVPNLDSLTDEQHELYSELSGGDIAGNIWGVGTSGDEITREWLKGLGYDGLHIKEAFMGPDGDVYRRGLPEQASWVAFDPDQISKIDGSGLGGDVAQVIRDLGYPEEMATDQLFQEFVIYSEITRHAEKSTVIDPFSPESARLAQTRPYDWKAFSESRGYTEAEIADYEHWMDLVEEVDAKYPEDGTGAASTSQGFIYNLETEFQRDLEFRRFGTGGGASRASIRLRESWEKYGGMFGFGGLALANGIEYSDEPQIQDWDSFANVMWGEEPTSSFGRAMKVAQTTGQFNEGLDPGFWAQLDEFINDSDGEVQPLMGRMDPADYKHMHHQLLKSDPELAAELGEMANTSMTNGMAAMLHYPNGSHWATNNADRYGLRLREGFDNVVEPVGERLKQGPTDFSTMTEADKVRHFMEVAGGTLKYRDPVQEEAASG